MSRCFRCENFQTILCLTEDVFPQPYITAPQSETLKDEKKNKQKTTKLTLKHFETKTNFNHRLKKTLQMFAMGILNFLHYRNFKTLLLYSLIVSKTNLIQSITFEE